MTNNAAIPSAAPLFGGSLIVAIDLGEAIVMTVMAAEDAARCGLIDAAGFADLPPMSGEALKDEDAYLDWLAERWGYNDRDERLDAVTSHCGRS